MSNPFLNLISNEFKALHENMIDATIQDCSVSCLLHYSSTKFESCVNCLYDPIGGKSSNRYLSGGPTPFYHGSCPLCNGSGKTQVVSDEEQDLAPIWDSKSWYKMKSTVNMAEVDVQTMSNIDTYNKLKRCSSVTIDSSVKSLGIPDFIRVGDPEICGLGGSNHVITAWKRIG